MSPGVSLQDSQYLRAVLDAFPVPVFVLGSDFGIEDANAAAAAFTGSQISGNRRRLCGDLLHCLRAAEAAGGCGTSEFCKECVVRNSFYEALQGQKPVRRKNRMVMRDDHRAGPIDLLISAAPFTHAGQSYVLLTLEDVTELFTLRRLIPICSYCRKVRDDKDYWRQVESYLHQACDLQFTHGICPECAKKLDVDGTGGSDPSAAPASEKR